MRFGRLWPSSAICLICRNRSATLCASQLARKNIITEGASRDLVESRRCPQISLREMALVFLKLGTIAFGGPAAHIAMMEDEFVTRRQWLTREQFLDRLGAANLIPGPSSTEMAIFIGYEKRGWLGFLVAGCCFILPAAVM